VASHGGPILDMLDVIEYDPRVFQISSWLHPIDQVYPGSGPTSDILKTNTLSESEP
jgi:hypothetical protein